MEHTVSSPASLGPSVTVAPSAHKSFRLLAWRRFARVLFATAMVGFVPSIGWSFSAWGRWLLDRREVLTDGTAMPLPFVESTTFALLGWLVIAAAALHAWAHSELARTPH